MKKNQKRSVIIFAALTATCSLTWAQTPNGTTLEQQLEAEYTITTPTADNTDLVTTGAVLILQKKGLSAGSVSSKVSTLNTYKDGQIRAGAAAAVRRFGALPGIGGIPGVGGVAGAAGGSRDFVNGEKIYVTKITVDRAKDFITFDLISDAYGDAGRFKASLRFEFPKKSLVSATFATIQPTIAEVFKVAPPADPNASASAAQGGQPAAAPAAVPAPIAAPAAPPEPALAPIAPPPPPPADPKSIENGMTKEQVVAIMGEPIGKAKVGTKDIYTYKDLKIIFVNGKMTDAQ
jgi:hypothetical protein